jgi:hypothetical protein
MPATYTPISRGEIEAVLLERGFTEALRPGIGERIYSKPVKETDRYRLAVVVYSSIAMGTGQSRNVGDDAIRVVMEVSIPGRSTSKIVQGARRVHRTQGWRNNLAKRIAEISRLTPPECPSCGLAMTLRKNRQPPAREFWGCIRYPDCRGTKNKE